VTCSPPEIPEPEKSRVKTVMFEGSKIIAASLASALHPLSYKHFTQSAQPYKIEIYKLCNTIHALWCKIKKKGKERV